MRCPHAGAKATEAAAAEATEAAATAPSRIVCTMRAVGLVSVSLVTITLLATDAQAASNRWCAVTPNEARTAVMRRSIRAGPTCWGSGAGADRIRFPARRLERAAPGRLVHRARIEAGIKSQAVYSLTLL